MRLQHTCTPDSPHAPVPCFSLQADALGQPCYVEVTKPAEVPLLASLGFAPLPGEVFTLFSQPVTVMVRPARK